MDQALAIVNILVPLNEKLRGSALMQKLLKHLRELLESLSQRPEILNDDPEDLKELLKNADLKVNTIITNFE